MMCVLLVVLAHGAAEDRLFALKTVSADAKFLKASESFLGTPYANSPLGEGTGVDADPLVSFEAVDCLTLVEQSLALSLVSQAAEFQRALNLIRYSDEGIAWNNRLHIMESQWIPTQEKRGLIKNVTPLYSNSHLQKVTKIITGETWNEKMGLSLHLPVEKQTVGSFELQMIPTQFAVDALKKVPSGSLVVVIRKDRPKTVTMVTHVAVVVQTKNGTLIRHASRTFKKVIDEPVEKYLKRNLDFGAWTIEGLALYQVAQEWPKELGNGILTRH
jgi:hypothetical protein